MPTPFSPLGLKNNIDTSEGMIDTIRGSEILYKVCVRLVLVLPDGGWGMGGRGSKWDSVLL